MIMTLCCVSQRRMQNPVIKVVLQLYESSQGDWRQSQTSPAQHQMYRPLPQELTTQFLRCKPASEKIQDHFQLSSDGNQNLHAWLRMEFACGKHAAYAKSKCGMEILREQICGSS